MNLADAVGIGFSAVGEEHLFSMFLSSPGTVRKLYTSAGVDTSELHSDLNIALFLGVGFSVLMAWLLKSKLTAWVGIGFGVVLYALYIWRAEL